MTDTDRPEPDTTDADRVAPDEHDASSVEQRLAGELDADDIEVSVVGETDVEIEDGQLAYECNAWSAESRDLLDSLLTTKSIPHVWQGTTVTVRDEDESAVDDLIDEVLASAGPSLDPSAAKAVYAVGAWPVALQTQLVDALAVDDIAYEWDENGDLVVLESDEDAVSAVIDELPDVDDEGVSSDDGVALHELFDTVFMASGRLAKRPNDASATVDVVDSADLLAQVALPFGFEPAQWRTLVAAVAALREAISPTDATSADASQVDADHADSGPAGDDEIAELAAVARDTIRQYI
ncbi:MAG: hypothetical protein M3Y51_08730 [Actinomycetota bacterium]|nr:hypothetical protein [Actinomycetota bacterium]